jgi:hypothetical protein
MSTDINEKEIVFRLAQSLMNEIKSQMHGGMKAGTDVRPYAKRYNLLRERIISFQIKDSDKLIPELPEHLVTSGLTNDLLRNAALFDELIVASLRWSVSWIPSKKLFKGIDRIRGIPF